MSLAIAVITAPRPQPTFNATIGELRRAGFRERLHVFAEPHSRLGFHPDVEVHAHPQRLGMWRNWLHAARWLLCETTASRLLICEDDLSLAAGAASALAAAYRTLPWTDFGYASLYTPMHNVWGQTLQNGWQPLSTQRIAWGSLALAFTRASLRELLHAKTTLAHGGQNGTDEVVCAATQTLGRRVYFHVPSLCAHAGGANSSVGHYSTPSTAAVGFDPLFGWDKSA
jgi:hypothetical protein